MKYTLLIIIACIISSCIKVKDYEKIKVEVTFENGKKDTITIFNHFSIINDGSLVHINNQFESWKTIAKKVSYVKELTPNKKYND